MKYDIVLWGASGFTGRLVAAHLARRAPAALNWAIAGRDRGRLEALRRELGVEIDLLVGDSLDRASLEPIVSRARVVVSTVGPYARYGTPLVEACVEHGVDYCDITGEVPWIRGNIDRLHPRAVERGSRIVHCCGFDSIPSDLGVWMLHEHLRRTTGRRLTQARFFLAKVRGGFSGGTAASLLDVMEQVGRDPSVRRILAHPYALNPEGQREGPDAADQRGARFDTELERWTAPFLMAAINTRIVRRSNALLDYPYGRDFRYAESVLTRGRMQAHVAGLGLSALLVGSLFRPTRKLLSRFMPAPGAGPDAERREAGFFEVRLVGRSDGDPAVHVRGRVRGEHDPGYGETSSMLAESALCLAQDDLPPRGGILTPASCLGTALIDRLRAVGMTFEVG